MNIRVTSENEAIGIQLMDGKFNVVARSQGGLSADVQPGLYRLRFELGSEIHVQDLEVEKDIVIDAPVMLRTSAAPLPGTTTSHVYQFAPAQRLSKQIHVNLGGDAGLFVFAREQDDRFAWGQGGKGITIRDLDGRILADLTAGETSIKDRYAGMSICLAPGTYRLRCEDGPVEMPVVTCNGWQTQVFLNRGDFIFDDGNEGRCFDLGDAALLMARRDKGFDFSNPRDIRSMDVAEGARSALKAGNRISLSSVQMNDLLLGKFDNPLLGIYGGHLLLLGVSDVLQRARKAMDTSGSPIGFSDAAFGLLYLLSADGGQREFNRWIDEMSRVPALADLVPDLRGVSESWSVAQGVVQRLSEGDLAGQHPDVRALLLPLGQNVGVFESPPMLRASWRLVVEASATNADLVPPDSLAGRVSLALCGSASWMIWNPNKLHDVGKRRRVASVFDLSALQKRLEDPGFLASTQDSLSEVEQSTLSAATGYAAANSAPMHSISDSPVGSDGGFLRLLSLLPHANIGTAEEAIRWVSQSMQMPLNVAAEALSGISSKITISDRDRAPKTRTKRRGA